MKRKSIKYLIFVFIALFSITFNVNAENSDSPITSCSSITDKNTCEKNDYFACVWNEKSGYCNVDNLQYVMCGDAHDIPERLPSLTSFVIYLLKIATPIILIIVSIITLVKAIMSSKEDEIKKAQNSLVRKIVAAVIIFFVISIVQFVISKVADDSEQTSLSACMDCFLNNDCGTVKYYKDNINGEYFCYNVETKDGQTCDDFYMFNQTYTTFNCNVGGYTLKYSSYGTLLSATDSNGQIVAGKNLVSDFEPKRSSQCPTNTSAEIKIDSEKFHVSKINISDTVQNFTCNIGSYVLEYGTDGELVSVIDRYGNKITKSDKELRSDFKPKSVSECPTESNATVKYIDSNRTKL